MTRDEILQRYRRFRAISVRHHAAVLDCLATSAVLEQAKRLGLAIGNTLAADSDEEMMLVYDLATYAAKEGRSRAIDRYARRVRPAPGGGDALVLDAMRNARFSIWEIRRRHEVAGLILEDVMRETEVWLVDEAMEANAEPGTAFAARLHAPDAFAMTCNMIVPVDPDMLIEAAAYDALAWRHGAMAHVADDPRFAIALYRAGIECGVIDRVRFVALGGPDPAAIGTASLPVPSGLPAPA